VLPLTFYDNYHKYIGVNSTHANLYFLLPHIPPFSLTKVFLFTFYYQSDCRAFYHSFVESSADPLCIHGAPVYQLVDDEDNSFPSIRLDDLIVSLHLRRGLISRIHQNGVRMMLKQELEAYVFWDKSESGFYVFDPNRAPVSFKHISVDRIISYQGDIYSCLHSFISQAKTFNTIQNAYFENRVCV